MFIAIVHSADGVRFTAAAVTRHHLVEQLATYVSRSVHHQLWPFGAWHVQSLLDEGALEAAVEEYFALVGFRWDEEWLVTATMDTGLSPHCDASLDRVVAVQPLVCVSPA